MPAAPKRKIATKPKPRAKAADAKTGGPLDILIAGAGYVGLATAAAIAHAAPHLSVRVVDPAPDGVWKKDGRASAIAAAASRMLEAARLLGCDPARRRSRSPR